MTIDLDYHITQAIAEARKLSKDIRQANSVPLDPKHGKLLAPMPVFEGTQPMSLLKKTNELCDTKIICVNQPAVYVNGYWKRYERDGKLFSVVTIPQSHNYCWARFIICKELMHNYSYNTGNSTTEIADLINLMMNLMTNWTQGPQSIADTVAYYGALEYLMPLDTMPLIRAVHLQIFSEVKDQGKTNNIIAHLLRVPLQMVEFRLSTKDYFE